MDKDSNSSNSNHENEIKINSSKKMEIFYSLLVEITNGLIKWIFFTVGISLTPPLCGYLIKLTEEDYESSFFYFSTSNGSLFIISAALVGKGLSEILINKTAANYLKLLLGGLSIIFLMVACILFAEVTYITSISELIVSISSKLFLASLITSMSCHILPAFDKINNNK